jgi:release factor glutamine methyltransferase
LTIREALKASGLESREARLIFAAAAGCSEASVLAHADRDVPPAVLSSFVAMCARRRDREPVAYILGRQEFYGIDLAVDRSVLIPRPETELLVELALERSFRSVADLGTGSGAIALAIKRHRPAAKVVAVDASEAALTVARRNAARHSLKVDFRHGHWFGPLPAERFDLIVANPPYVCMDDPHLEALRHEPPKALVAGPEGLEALREIAAAAPDYMAHGAWLLLEHGKDQDASVRAYLKQAGLAEVTTWPDLAGIGRVTGGKR